jgi:hypothetical protein
VNTPIYFIYHVPKTGGTTIRKHIEGHLQCGSDFVHIKSEVGVSYKQQVDTLMTTKLDAACRKQLLAILGHPVSRRFVELFPGRPVREVVFVREPADRLVSHYNFDRRTRALRNKPPVTFEVWLERQGPNPMTRFLSDRLGVATNVPSQLSDLLQELAKFWMIGVTENLDQTGPVLFDAMGLPADVPLRSNVTGVSIKRHMSLTPDLRDELRVLHPLDTELHAACKGLEQRSLERLDFIPDPGRAQR